MDALIYAAPALVAALLAWDGFRRWLKFRAEERELGAGARLDAIESRLEEYRSQNTVEIGDVHLSVEEKIASLAADQEDHGKKLSDVITYVNGTKIAAGRRGRR